MRNDWSYYYEKMKQHQRQFFDAMTRKDYDAAWRAAADISERVEFILNWISEKELQDAHDEQQRVKQ